MPYTAAPRFFLLCLLFLACLAAAPGAAASEPPNTASRGFLTGDGSSGVAPAPTTVGDTGDEYPGAELARRLAHLDERLELKTYPDGSGLWLARLAASLERRLRLGDKLPRTNPHLLSQLASQLRQLGVAHDLAPMQEAAVPGGDAAPDDLWLQGLEALQETVRRLHTQLDEAAAPPGAVPPALVETAPANDACGAATDLFLGTLTGNSAGATSDGTSSCGFGDDPDVWFRYVSGAAEPVVFDTAGSAYSTTLALYDACPAEGGAEVACETYGITSTRARLVYVLEAGEVVWLRLGGDHGSTGDYQVAVSRAGAIQGRVTRSEDGTPLTGIAVKMGYSSISPQTTTDDDGSYIFPGLPSSSHTVFTAAEERLNQAWDAVPCPPWETCAFLGDRIEVSEGDIVTGIDFALSPGGSISGRTTDAAGQPLEAYVRIYDAYGTFRTTVLSDPDGSYVLGGLPAGTYYLIAEAEDHALQLFDGLTCHYCVPPIGTPVEVATGGDVENVDFALDRLGAIEGTLTDQRSGDPIPSERVLAQGRDVSGSEAAYTTSDGTYRVGRLREGHYQVSTQSDRHRDEQYDDSPCDPTCEIADAQLVPVLFNTTTHGIDFALDRLGRIRGAVGDGTGSGDFSVQLWRPDDSYPLRYDRVRDGLGYEFDGVSPGTYRLLARSTLHQSELWEEIPCPGDCDVEAGTPVTVDLYSDLTGLDFTLVPLGSVAGRVTEEGSGLPLSFAFVQATTLDGAVLRWDYTDSDGRYLIEGLRPEAVYVHTGGGTHLNQVWQGRACPEGCQGVEGDAVGVTLGQTTPGIDFVLTRKATIRGRVTEDPTGTPLSGVKVRLYDGQSETWIRQDWSDGDGHYELQGLDAGTYRLGAHADEHRDELFDGLFCGYSCDPSSGAPISIGLGDTLEADFTLQRANEVSGTVLSAADGAPIPGARVRLYHPTDGWLGWDITNSLGAYRLEGLEPGTHYLAADSSGYLPMAYDGQPCPEPCDPSAGTAVSVNGTVTGIDFTLDRLGVIRGSLTDGAGASAIPGEVILLDPSGATVEIYYTRGGSYQFSIPAGTYYLRAESYDHFNELYDDVPCEDGCDLTTGTPVTVALNEEAEGIDFALDGFGGFGGSIRDARTGQFLYDSTLRIHRHDGSLVRSVWIVNGNYVVEDLAPGTYYVEAVHDTHEGQLYDAIPCSPTCDPLTGTPVTVELNTVTGGIDFDLSPRGSIAGTVTDSLTGAGLWGIELTVWDGNGLSRWTRTSGGVFRVEGLPAGTYWIRVSGASYGDPYRYEIYDDIPCAGVCDETPGAPVLVSDGAATTGIHFVLDPLASLSGVVSGSSGAYLSSAGVELYDLAGNRLAFDHSSYFEFERIEPGSYYLKALHLGSVDHQDELYDDVPCDPDCDFSLGTPVTVGLGDIRTGLDFRLAQCDGDSHRQLVGQLFFATATVDACATLTAVESTIDSGADVTFRAGRSIVLGDGFSVHNGGRFRAVIEPEWGEDPPGP